MGNARVTYSDANSDGVIAVADIKQINHYYPFGMNMEGNWNGAAGSNKYQYNGKEWNDDFGLGLNDYGARWYASDAPRWINVDPLSELRADVSPYQYVQNNPINAIDPTGMLDESFYKGSDRDASMRMRGENMAIENATWRMSFWDNYYNNAKLVPFGTRVEDSKGNVIGTPTIEGYNVVQDPTYNYKGVEYKEGSLYSAIFWDKIQYQWGITDLSTLATVGGFALSLPLISKRFVTPGSAPKTSLASLLLRYAPWKSQKAMMTLTENGFKTTTSYGAYFARAIPIATLLKLTWDYGKILYETQKEFSRITGDDVILTY